MLLFPVSKQLQAKCSFIQREAALWQTVASRALSLQVAMVSAHLIFVESTVFCGLIQAG